MTAFIRQSASDTKRVMIYETGNGAYLFGYNTLEDAGASWDKWYADAQDAKDAALEEYGVNPAADWSIIADPLDNCQHDWIAPVRVKGRFENKPEWGCFEKLVDNQWLPI
jgi:hypothetical protein